LTLIEILIAIIVLTIGVISILAIFPASIKSASSSVDDTVAAKIAESVSDALNIAMRAASAEDVAGSKSSKAIIVHDGLPGGSYEFALPLPMDPPPGRDQPRFFAHQANSPTEASTPSPKPSSVFKLGNTEFMKKVVDDVTKGPDPSDSYSQYGFTFTIKRIDDDRPATETGNKYTPNPLFQFAIAVYRLTPDFDTKYKDELPQPVHVFIVMIGGK
jgi:hypothetical protein